MRSGLRPSAASLLLCQALRALGGCATSDVRSIPIICCSRPQIALKLSVMLSIASSAFAFNAAPLAVQPVSRASVSMKVEDLVGGINDPIFGGTPEGKIWDPLGLGQDEASLYRRRVVEIKHGRICMMAFLGMTIGSEELIQPSSAYLSVTENIKFSDIPGGIAAIDAVPGAGWAQIVAVVGVHELTVNKQDYTKVPGEIPTFLGFKPEDPEEFKSKQLKELKNGRLAMIAVLGELSKSHSPTHTRGPLRCRALRRYLCAAPPGDARCG